MSDLQLRHCRPARGWLDDTAEENLKRCFLEARFQVLVIVFVCTGILLQGKLKCEEVRSFIGMDSSEVARCMDNEKIVGMLYLCRNKLYNRMGYYRYLMKRQNMCSQK